MPDGRSVTYYIDRQGVSNVVSQALEGGPPKPVTDFRTDLFFSYDWSADGRIVSSRGTIARDAVIVSRFR
jgi:hypothetical protein